MDKVIYFASGSVEHGNGEALKLNHYIELQSIDKINTLNN